MSWTRIYGLVLHLLPEALRVKHGAAMEALYARELQRARARGAKYGALAGATGVCDVVRRAAYEHARRACGLAMELFSHGPLPGRDLHAHGPQRAGASPGGSTMSQLPIREHLRRHAASFAVAFSALTAALLALNGWRQAPLLREAGASAGTVVEVLLLSVPFTAALTVPMAVLVAVLHQFTRLRADGTLTAARGQRDGVRRLVVPVLAAAVAVAALELVLTAEIVPRTNTRLATMLAAQVGVVAPHHPKSDREMTIAELRATVRDGDLGTGEHARRRSVAYEVEIQKKLALPAACVIMAVVGVAIAVRVPRSGTGLVIGASFAVFAAYYALIVTGESLADRLVVSPFVGMWGGNILLMALALLAMWRRRPPFRFDGSEVVAIGH